MGDGNGHGEAKTFRVSPKIRFASDNDFSPKKSSQKKGMPAMTSGHAEPHHHGRIACAGAAEAPWNVSVPGAWERDTQPTAGVFRSHIVACGMQEFRRMSAGDGACGINPSRQRRAGTVRVTGHFSSRPQHRERLLHGLHPQSRPAWPPADRMGESRIEMIRTRRMTRHRQPRHSLQAAAVAEIAPWQQQRRPGR